MIAVRWSEIAQRRGPKCHTIAAQFSGDDASEKSGAFFLTYRNHTTARCKMTTEIEDETENPSARTVRASAIMIADQYVADAPSLFNLALAIEHYVNTGEVPDFDENDDENSDGRVLN